MLPDGGVLVPPVVASGPVGVPGRCRGALGDHLGDAPLVHLGHPELPFAEPVRLALHAECARRRRTGSPRGSRTRPRAARSPVGRPRSSMLIRPSRSQRRPSTRTTSGSSSVSNSSGRSPTRAPSRSLTVRTPSTPPCSSTTTAKARRWRRISARTSRTRRDSGTRNGWRSRREMSIGSGDRPPSVGGTDRPTGPEEVVDEQDADQVVEVLAADRKARVARLADGLGDTVDGQGDGQRGHVDPRGHDLPDRGVPQVVEGVDDELLLGVGPFDGQPVGVRSGGGLGGVAPA